MNPLVRVVDLTKSYQGRKVVDELNFSVSPGEVLGFLGPNGAGKSTTMKMLTGFLRPDTGSVEIAGKSIRRQTVAAQIRLGYLPEGAPLYGDMRTRAFLDFVASVRGVSGRRVEEVAARVNLESVMDQDLETLSKGFKRRVGLAQAIMHDPPVLILDEPTDGLDPNQKHEVRQLIAEMARDKAIILSTHILEEVDAVCSRAMIIAQGKVVADGTPTELRDTRAARSRVELCFEGEAEAVGRVLLEQAAVVGITDNSPDGSIRKLLIEFADGAEPVDVAKLVSGADCRVVEIRQLGTQMEDVFREVTGGGHQLS